MKTFILFALLAFIFASCGNNPVGNESVYSTDSLHQNQAIEYKSKDTNTDAQ